MLLHLANAADACSQSRSAVAEHLRGCDVDDDEIYVASLLATELVSNALRHAAPALCLQVDAAEDRVRVEVHDSSRTAPTMKKPAGDSGGGRGLWLVDTLSVDWGHRPHEVGKVVWVDVARTRP
jgi:anti-sigma regulatory factor (Ser/Thr protein kinase)